MAAKILHFARRDLRGDDGELVPAGDYVRVFIGTSGFVLSAMRGELPIVGFNLADQGGLGIAYAFCTDQEIVAADEFVDVVD
jgi:hypothetical protein